MKSPPADSDTLRDLRRVLALRAQLTDALRRFFRERGFLEVLDAQRVYRAARAELIAARYELASAWVEIERLRASPGGKTE